MKDCPETSGNRPRRFPAGFLKIDKITGIFSMHISRKKFHSRSGITSDFGFLLESYQKPMPPVFGGFQRFPEVSGQSFIDGPHGMTEKLAFLNFYPPLLVSIVCERPPGAGAGTNAPVR